MKVRKGQKARVLRTNEIVKVMEVQLIRKYGNVHQYCRLKADGKPDLWLDSSGLAEVKETEIVTLKSEGGMELEITIVHDYSNHRTTVNYNAIQPEDLRLHTVGTHGFAIKAFVEVFNIICKDTSE